jgi:hypothetical protein
MSAWGQGPWTSASLAQASPPTIVLNNIDNAAGSRSYTVSWVAPSIEVQQYVLQESKDPNFATLTNEWTIASGTSKAISLGSGSSGTFYYRVRADDSNCWGQGPWSAAKSTIIYISYDFNSSCPSWAMRESTGDDGPPGSDWYSSTCDDGKLKISVADRWEHIIVSPLVDSPDRPFEIKTSIYFKDRSWSSGYALIFGIKEAAVEHYYRVNVVYLSDGHMMFQIKRCEGDHGSEGETITKGVAGANDAGYIQVPKEQLNGQEWNEWRGRRSGSHIKVYANDNELIDIEDDNFTGVGYFGLMVSTWEFQPATIWVDYFEITPL